MNARRWSTRPVLCLAGFAMQGLLHLGAPADAQAQTQGPEKSWRQRHPVMFDTLIGTAAGAAVGCALGAASHSEVSCGYLAAPFGLLGAAIGVVPGLATERRNERNPLSFEDVHRRVKTGTTVVFVNARGETTAGKVVDVSGDVLTMRSEDGSTRALTSGAGLWHLTSDSLKNGIVIGAAIGGVISVANYKDGAGAGAITGVPIWALIGALADRAFGHQVLTANEEAPGSSATLQVSPWFGKRSGGVALSLGF